MSRKYLKGSQVLRTIMSDIGTLYIEDVDISPHVDATDWAMSGSSVEILLSTEQIFRITITEVTE